MSPEGRGWPDERRPPSGHMRAVLGGLAIAVFLSLACGVGTLALRGSTPDLTVYHMASGHVRSDDVYDHLFPTWPFVYPPPALLLMLPVAAPLRLAQLMMFVASVAAVWLTLYLVATRSWPGSKWSSVAAVSLYSAATLVSWPLILATGLGQASPVVMGLSALGALGRSRWRGAFVGVATALKLTPGLFAVHFWLTGRRRDAWVSGCVFLGLFLIAALAMPRSSWAYITGGLGAANDWYAGDPGNLSNQALTGVAARWGIDSSAGRWAVLLISALLLVGALRVAVDLHRAGWDSVAVPLLGIWSAVAAPVGWVHAFGWLVPLSVAIALRGRTTVDVLIAIGLPTFALLPLVGWLAGWPSVGGLWALTWTSTYPIAALVVTLWLRRRVRRPQSGQRPETLFEGVVAS